MLRSCFLLATFAVCGWAQSLPVRQGSNPALEQAIKEIGARVAQRVLSIPSSDVKCAVPLREMAVPKDTIFTIQQAPVPNGSIDNMPVTPGLPACRP